MHNDSNFNIEIIDGLYDTSQRRNFFGEQNVTSNLCEMENFTSQLQVIIEIVKCDPKLNFIKLDIGEI